MIDTLNIQNTKPETCLTCEKTFVCEFSVYIAKHVKVCPECSEKQAAEDQKTASRQGLAEYYARDALVVPEAFRNTISDRLPRPDRLREVLRWRYGTRGLVMHGATGMGKSRCLYELLKRENKNKPTIRILILDHSAGYDYAALFAKNPTAASRWVENHSTAGILALDDIFKVKLTDSFEQAIFSITATRTEKGLPLIVTCNDVGDSLAARMSPDRGPALVRRLRESCDIISF